MITPFESMQVVKVSDKKVISYGPSSYGYDIRCSNEFKVFRRQGSLEEPVDPKNFDPSVCEEHVGSSCVIPPNSFVLGVSLEKFRIPSNVLTICLGKSTYARCGVIVNVTPFEPGWEGYATLEFSNSLPLPVRIYANEGVAQVLFLEGDDRCDSTYADRFGKYQGQVGVTYARL
jgi:dCTP deaminase